MGGHAYILASRPYGTLYIGVTSDLSRRVWEHRLVYYEEFDDITFAIHRERRLKHYPRQWKINLIEGMNPTWADLYETWNC